MLQTPLNAFHRECGARLVEFAGWEMPVMYTSIIEEHSYCRQHGALFDVSHMGRIEFRGSDAEQFLERLHVALFRPPHVRNGIIDALVLVKRIVAARPVRAGHPNLQFLSIVMRIAVKARGHRPDYDNRSPLASDGASEIDRI